MPPDGNPDGGIPIAIPKFELGKFLAGLVGPFFRQVWKTYKTAIGKLMAYGAVWSFRAGMSVRPDMMRNTFFHCFEKYLAYDTEWTQAARAYMQFITGTDPGPMDPTNIGQMTAENIGEHFLLPMLNLVLPGNWQAGPTGQALRPEDGLDGAEKFLGVNMRFQMQSFLMSFITDFMGVEGARSITNFPQNFSWAFGFGWLSWLVMGVPFRLAISEPLERYFQKYFRMKDLSLSQIADLYWSDPTFRTEAIARLQEMGYTDDDIARLLNKERRKLSRSELEELWNRDRLEFEDIVSELTASGTSPEQATVLASMIVNKRYYDLIEDLATEAATQYRKGTVTAAELRQYLAAAGYKSDEIGLKVARLDLAKLEPPEAEPKPTGLTRGMIGGLYRDGERDRPWTILKLTGFNWDPTEVDDFLDYYRPPEEKPPTPRRATAAMIGKLYKTRQLTELEARAGWVDVGVVETDIELYVRYYAPPPEWPPEFRLPVPMKPTTIAGLYKRMVITRDEAVYLLSLLDVAQNDALLYLALYAPPETAAPPDRPELGIYEIVTAVAKGLMTLEEGVAGLVERGWDQAEAASYLKVQVAYQIAWDAVADCQAGRITFAQALSRMIAAGWTPRDADIYLKARGCEP